MQFVCLSNPPPAISKTSGVVKMHEGGVSVEGQLSVSRSYWAG